MPRVFISYRRQDGYYKAKKLTEILQKHEVWLDVQRLHLGDNWWTKIQQQIRDCDAFIFLTSVLSLQSEYCLKELDLALSCEKLIIPIYIDKRIESDPNLPKKLSETQAIKWYRRLNVDEAAKLWLALDRIPLERQNSLTIIARKEESDRKRLQLIWRCVSSQFVQDMQLFLEERQIPRRMEDKIDQYFRLRNRQEYAFYSEVLENEFKEFDRVLGEFRGILWRWYRHTVSAQTWLLPGYVQPLHETPEDSHADYLRSNLYFELIMEFQETLESFGRVREQHITLVKVVSDYFPDFFPYEE